MTQIYLISPPKIELKSFSIKLISALKTNLIPAFQLRLKNYEKLEIKKISQELKKICQDYNCLFLLNDNLEIALDIGANGVHLGSSDGSISFARKNSPENFVIGASCYDSKHLAIKACEQGANYVSFGAFFPSKTKISSGKPTTEILEWSNEILNVPSVAIGGITDENCHSLVKSKADFLAVISYIWDNPQGEVDAVSKLFEAIKNSYTHI